MSSPSAAHRRESDTETRPVSRAELLSRFWDEIDKRRVAATKPAGNMEGRETVVSADAEGIAASELQNQVFRRGAVEPTIATSVEYLDRPSFTALQEWEGYVVDVGASTFVARLTDLTVSAGLAEEEVQVLIADLSDDDREMLAPGRVFRWAIGYQRSAAGSKKRVSQIVFRRLPGWTHQDLEQAKKEAKELARSIKWD